MTQHPNSQRSTRRTAAPSSAALGGIFENAPWVAERAIAARPFATVAELHGAMMASRCRPPSEAEQLA